MSVERVALASLLASLRRATAKEVSAIQKILWLLEHEEREGEEYRSGVNLGAYSATSIMTLERQMQECLHLFLSSLGPQFREGMESCQTPILQLDSSSSEFDVALRQSVQTLAFREKELQEMEQRILEADAETIARLLPDSVRERIEAELQAEIDKLGQ